MSFPLMQLILRTADDVETRLFLCLIRESVMHLIQFLIEYKNIEQLM